MNSRRGRKLTLADALVLIAAIAIGLAWSQAFRNCEEGGESYPSFEEEYQFSRYPHLSYAIVWLDWWSWYVGHCLAVVTIALLLLRLRDQSPRDLRWLTRRPGAVAGGAVALTVSIRLVYAAARILQEHRANRGMALQESIYLNFPRWEAFLAVLVAWTLLRLSRRWQRESSWLDRLGFALGQFWLLQGMLYVVAHFVAGYSL